MERDGFRYEGSGELLRIDVFTTSGGKDIVTLVVKVDGKYPQYVPIKLFGRQGDDYRNLPHGTRLRIRGRLGGREYQGKVYADITADEIQVSKGTVQTTVPVTDDDVAF